MRRPLFTGDQRETVIRTVHGLVAVVETIESREAADHADRAVLRAHLAHGEIVPDPDDTAGAALSDAVATLTTSRQMLGLFGGTAGIGWAVAQLADGDVAQLVCARIDAALEQAVDRDTWPYDLIAGITGFGVYALARGAAGQHLATRVVRALARRARPRPVGIAWHTAPTTLPASQREQAPLGYWNLGVAHGTPGVIAFLRAVGSDIAGARYGAWICGPADGTETHATPSPALAWCYHDLGIALALLSAANVTGSSPWRDDALALARDCARRPSAEARIHGSSLCHGAAGAAHMFLRLHHATGEEVFADSAQRWFERALDMDPPLAEAASAEEAALKRLDPSLLSGAAGVALALHAAITDVEPTWDGRLLLDLAGA